jgi:predicted RNase H-like nuclease
VNDGTAVGVDWYKGGWVGVALDAGGDLDVLVDPDLATLIERVPGAACVGVDMPIGLPAKEREADKAARAFVGRRWPSVFATPPEAVFGAGTYADANAVATQLVGKKISQQAWALRHNIKRVAEVATGDPRIIEVHPEVSFRALVGKEIAFAKTTWNGHALRRAALAREGIVLADDLGTAGIVPVADVLDAAAAAWTARRYANDRAESLPAGAARGAREVIWY